MSIELLQTLSLVSYIVAAVLFLTAIALFFLLDIKKVFGDVTGRTARRAIESIRQQNEASGDNAGKAGAVDPERAADGSRTPKTEKFATAILNPQAIETARPGTGNETTVLSQNTPGAGETTVLDQPSPAAVPTAKKGVLAEFTVDVEMGFVGSSEIIE